MTIATDGTSTVTVQVVDEQTNAGAADVELNLSTNLGALSPTSVITDSAGRATSTLMGDGRAGTARVTASFGDNTESVDIEIVSEMPSSLELTATPSTIQTDETSTLTISGVTGTGDPLEAGTQVDVTTTRGALSSPRVRLDAMGRATVTLTPDGRTGTATVTAALTDDPSVSTDARVEIVAASPVPPPMLEARPTRVEKQHIRQLDPCPDELEPVGLTTSGGGAGGLRYRVSSAVPAWLQVIPMDGPVPSTVELSYTCDVPSGGALDLQHDLTFQGVDLATGQDVGDSAVVDVRVHVSSAPM